MAVIDAYDAMTTDRPYRDAMPYDAAMDILRDGAGKQWDPTVVSVLLESVDLRGGDDDDHDHRDGHSHGRIDDLVLPEHLRETDEVSS